MKILIVDDNAFIVDVILKMLAGRGYDFHTRKTTEDAIAYFDQGKVCDLLITDIILPGEDGTKLAQHVKGLYPDLPVLAITGGVENAKQDYAHYAEMFADKVLQKPLRKDELITVIEGLAG